MVMVRGGCSGPDHFTTQSWSSHGAYQTSLVCSTNTILIYQFSNRVSQYFPHLRKRQVEIVRDNTNGHKIDMFRTF